MKYDQEQGDSIATRFMFFLLGAGFGALVGLLFAPKPGEELRGDIADATRKGIDKSKEAAQQLAARSSELYDTARETAGEYYETTRERAAELYDTAVSRAGEVVTKTRDSASRQTGSLQGAFEAGKKAYIDEERRSQASRRAEASDLGGDPTKSPRP